MSSQIHRHHHPRRLLTIAVMSFILVIVGVAVPSSASAATCRQQTSSFVLRDGGGSVLGRYNIRIRWCYDGRRVTYADDERWTSTTLLGKSFLYGLRWKPGSMIHREGYFTYNGRTRGGWVSRQRIVYEICPTYPWVGTVCYPDVVKYMNFYVYYNGTSRLSYSKF